MLGHWKHPRHRCDKCGGVFLGREHLVEILGPRTSATLEQQATGVVQTADGSITRPVRRSLVRCPRDGASMCQLAFKGAELKLCPDCHSIWLPEAEFSKIVAAMKPPARVPKALGRGPGGITTGEVIDGVGETLEAGEWLSEFFEGLGSIDL